MTNRRAFLSGAVAVAVSQTVKPCSCVQERGSVRARVLRARKDATIVVLAKVVDVKVEMGVATAYGAMSAESAQLQVIENWKGPHGSGSVIRTTTPTSIGMCGMGLDSGATYLLYLYGEAPYDVSVCSRNAKIEEASEDISLLRKYFGKGRS
jgi:hypothetical protein